MIIPIFVISLASSILTELLKLFPALTKTVERKRIIAFVIAAVVSVIYVLTTEDRPSMEIAELIGGVLAGTFVIYKALIQPIVNIVVDPIKKALSTPKAV